MPAERILLPTDDGQLVGDYLPGSGDFAVVWVHGFGSHRGGEKAEAVRLMCTDRGWPFAAFDFRGHGETGGPMHELRAGRLLEDLARVHDFLTGRCHSRFGLIGSSMGGFAAAWSTVANPGPVVGCVFLAPAFGFLRRRWDRLTQEQREEWRRTDRLRVMNEWVDTELGYGLVEERDRFDPAELARRWATPALIFHGGADDVVPDDDSLAFYRGATFPDVELRLLKSGDHRLTAFKTEIATEAGRFFGRLLGPRPGR